MCEKCDAYKGPITIAMFDCGLCGREIATCWIQNGKGMLHSDYYTIIGQKDFHDYCGEQYLRPLNERTVTHEIQTKDI